MAERKNELKKILQMVKKKGKSRPRRVKNAGVPVAKDPN